MIPRWEHFEQGAAVGVRGLGDSKAEAFAQAALALTAAVTDPARVRAFEPVELHCTAGDDEELLERWLNALIREMTTRRMLFGKFDVRLDEGRLSARAWGEGLDPARHQPAPEVKGTASAAARVARHGDGWLAQGVIER